MWSRRDLRLLVRVMRQANNDARHENMRIPSKGDRIEIRRNGISLRGTVFHSDQLQILVKWDNGRSSSLRVGSDRFAIVDTHEEAAERERFAISRGPAQERRNPAASLPAGERVHAGPRPHTLPADPD